MNRISPEQVERFWSRVDIKGDDDCWEWTRSRSPKGYGRIDLNNTSYRAHRVSYYLEHGVEPDKMVLHSCDNPACVNPAHLSTGTAAENSRQMVDRGRSCRGAKNWKSKLTREQVIEIRRLRGTGMWPRFIAKRFGLRSEHVQNICQGYAWTWLEQPGATK